MARKLFWEGQLVGLIKALPNRPLWRRNEGSCHNKGRQQEVEDWRLFLPSPWENSLDVSKERTLTGPRWFAAECSPPSRELRASLHTYWSFCCFSHAAKKKKRESKREVFAWGLTSLTEIISIDSGDPSKVLNQIPAQRDSCLARLWLQQRPSCLERPVPEQICCPILWRFYGPPHSFWSEAEKEIEQKKKTLYGSLLLLHLHISSSPLYFGLDLSNFLFTFYSLPLTFLFKSKAMA